MVNDAKAHAEEDRKRREMVEERNKLDTLVYSTEKTMTELSDKASPEVKGAVNTALEDAKKALEANDQDKMKSAYAELEKAAHKLSEEAYKRAAASGEAAGAQAGNGAQGADAGKEDVVDADYEEVRGDK